MKTNDIYRKAIKKFGATMQMNVAMEECSELIKEISKIIRGKGNLANLAEEIADVEIMLEQLKLMYYIEEIVATKKDNKIIRLDNLVNMEAPENEKNTNSNL